MKRLIELMAEQWKYNSMDNDEDLFKKEMLDVTPLPKKHDKKVHHSVLASRKKRVISVPRMQNRAKEFYEPLIPIPIDADKCLSHQTSGLTLNQFNKLRQGKIPIQARLDLHQCTCAKAKKKIVSFIHSCHLRSISCCLIVHGKGQGLVKSVTDSVLREMNLVIAFHSAKPKDGGMGALYVLL